ncbi:MAG: MBL fold metallo-hydrolase [Acidilobaceae archaeon]
MRWCGHSYFIVESGGLKLAIDPHDGGSLGIETCYVEADIVLVTHDHYDHNAVEVASGRDTVALRWIEGLRIVKGVSIRGFKFYHDKSQGRLRGETIAYMVVLEDLRLLHLGDIGHTLTQEDVLKLAPVDVLFIPVGGVYTIDHHEAWTIIQAIKPKIVIPMHYWIPGALTPLNPIDRFLNIVKTPRVRAESREITIWKDRLPEKTTVIVPPSF